MLFEETYLYAVLNQERFLRNDKSMVAIPMFSIFRMASRTNDKKEFVILN